MKKRYTEGCLQNISGNYWYVFYFLLCTFLYYLNFFSMIYQFCDNIKVIRKRRLLF